eukprot:GHVU01225022.1.p2 GENE.GHVU01225022.1~~GHVU01225022.1.p2  ORF type:complete len:104 (+),score=4.34 GHVU01225022.1:155-466(+)
MQYSLACKNTDTGHGNGNQIALQYNALHLTQEDGVEISLTIDRIFPQAFRDYYITVKNSKGSSTAVVRLDRDLSMEKVAAASSLSACMLVLAAALALLQLLNH